MSIATTVRTAGPFAGTGSLVALPFAFKVFAASDLVVQRTNAAGDVATLTLTTHYSVSLNSDQDTAPGGTVTLVAALAVGETAALTSSVSATQPLQLASGGPFLPGQIEDALDRAMIVVQQQGVLGGQALRVPLGETALSLPSADQRANKALLFDADGDPYLAAPASGSAADVMLQYASTDAGKGASLVGYLPSGTGAVGRTVQAALREIPSVTDFGADPTGVADSAPAFAVAVAAAPADGTEYWVPPGRYLMNSGITVDKPVTFRGAGSSILNNSAGGTTLYKAATITTPLFTLAAGAAALKNMVLQGVTGNTGDGVLMAGGRQTLEDLSVYNMGNDGVRIGTDVGVNANLWTIRNLKSKGNTRNGLTLSDKVAPTGADCNGGTLLHADLQSNGAAGCELINAQLSTFVGLVSQNNTGRGLSLKPGADKNTFIGGDFEACGADEVGIEAGATSNVFIGGHVAGTMTDNGNNTLIFGMTDTQFVTGIKLGNFDSTDTKVLDWYEEGSWTPVLTFATPGDLSVTYSVQVGRFTRIGGMVTAVFTIATSAFTYTTASGQLRVTGLPYAAISTANLFATGALQYAGITGAATPNIVARIDPGNSYVGFLASGPGVGNVNVASPAVPSAGSIVLIATITYRVT